MKLGEYLLKMRKEEKIPKGQVTIQEPQGTIEEITINTWVKQNEVPNYNKVIKEYFSKEGFYLEFRETDNNARANISQEVFSAGHNKLGVTTIGIIKETKKRTSYQTIIRITKKLPKNYISV